MTDDKNKQQLIHFLERRAWNPVLKASPGKYDKSDHQRLERVQRKTESQRERYKRYDGAGQVRQEFQDDLRSQQAKKLNADLTKLDLPTQADVADEFFALADRLGITPERQTRRHHKPHPPHPWHKSKPEEREKAKRALKKLAREGDRSAMRTLETAPRKWARDYAAQLQKRRSSASKSTRNSARKRP
jgi:hypothetical protein